LLRDRAGLDRGLHARDLHARHRGLEVGALVADHAEDLREQIVHRDESEHLAVLAHDDRHVDLLLLEGQEQPLDRRGARHEQRLVQQLVERLLCELTCRRADEVLRVEDATHVIERLLIDGHAREPARRELLDEAMHREVVRQAKDAIARRHDLADVLVGELEHAMDQPALARIDFTARGARVDQRLELLFGEVARGPRARTRAERAQQHFGEHVHEHAHRRDDRGQAQERPRGRARPREGRLRGKGLRGDLGDQHEDRQRDRERDERAQPRRRDVAVALDQAERDHGEHRGTRLVADQHGRDQPTRTLEQRDDPAIAARFTARELLTVDATEREQRDLGPRAEPRDQHAQNGDRDRDR